MGPDAKGKTSQHAHDFGRAPSVQLKVSQQAYLGCRWGRAGYRTWREILC